MFKSLFEESAKLQTSCTAPSSVDDSLEIYECAIEMAVIELQEGVSFVRATELLRSLPRLRQAYLAADESQANPAAMPAYKQLIIETIETIADAQQHVVGGQRADGAIDVTRSRARQRIYLSRPMTQESGRCYEDFEVGAVLRHPLGRTVTATDNTWFSLLTNNSNPIHFDRHYSAQTESGQPLMNSTFTIAVIVGLSVSDISRHAINLGWNDVTLPAPVFEGDTLYAQSEVLSKRESRSRPTMGIVEVKTVGYKQDGTVVMTYRRAVLVYKRGHAPVVPTPTVIA